MAPSQALAARAEAALSALDVDVDVALDVDQASPMLRAGRCDAVVVELEGMARDVVDFLLDFREISPWVPILCTGGFESDGAPGERPYRALLDGGVLMLPDVEVLGRHLLAEVRASKERRRNVRLSRCVAQARELGVPLGFAPRWRRAMRAVEEASRSGKPVVLHGEVSTGRRTLARHLHECKAGEPRAFLEVDAVFDADVLATYETVYLREVDALGRECVRGLERLAESGGPQVVLATTRSRADLARAALTPFLEARQAVLIDVPPLRERREDIAMFATAFLEEEARESLHHGYTLRALALLQLWYWPGNLAELQNVVHHAFAITGGKQIGRRHLVGPQGILPVSLQLFAQGLGDDVTSWIAGEETDILPFEVEERRILARALAASGGNVTKAASALAIGRATLYRKIRDYGLRD